MEEQPAGGPYNDASGRTSVPDPDAESNRGHVGTLGAGGEPLKAAEINALMREVAQVVKRPDVGRLLAKVGAEDPLGGKDSVPKRKRIAAALIATDHRETDRGWIGRLLAAVDDYDRLVYVARVERLAEHLVELDTVRQVAARVPAWRGDQGDVSAHVGLTFWGAVVVSPVTPWYSYERAIERRRSSSTSTGPLPSSRGSHGRTVSSPIASATSNRGTARAARLDTPDERTHQTFGVALSVCRSCPRWRSRRAAWTPPCGARRSSPRRRLGSTR